MEDAAEGAQREMSGAEMVIRALKDNGVRHIFGYPGGAVLPIYDDSPAGSCGISLSAMNKEPDMLPKATRVRRESRRDARHVRARRDQYGHASSDALMDSIPLVVHHRQVPTTLIGSDAFQEADTVGITRPCTKHNYLVGHRRTSSRSCTRPFMWRPPDGPALFLSTFQRTSSSPWARYCPCRGGPRTGYEPQTNGDPASIAAAVELLSPARRPIIYSGGGVINSGPQASARLREFARAVGRPVTSTLMGLGAFPAVGTCGWVCSGMHGAFEANTRCTTAT